jgi:hypothetical protein
MQQHQQLQLLQPCPHQHFEQQQLQQQGQAGLQQTQYKEPPMCAKAKCALMRQKYRAELEAAKHKQAATAVPACMVKQQLGQQQQQQGNKRAAAGPAACQPATKAPKQGQSASSADAGVAGQHAVQCMPAAAAAADRLVVQAASGLAGGSPAAAAAEQQAAATQQQQPSPDSSGQLTGELAQYNCYSFDQLRYAARHFSLQLPQPCKKPLLAGLLLRAGRLPPFSAEVLQPRQRRRQGLPGQQQEQQQRPKRLCTTQQQQLEQQQQQEQRQQQQEQGRQRLRKHSKAPKAQLQPGAAAVAAPVDAAGGSLQPRSQAEKRRLQLGQLAADIFAKRRASGPRAPAPARRQQADAELAQLLDPKCWGQQGGEGAAAAEEGSEDLSSQPGSCDAAAAGEESDAGGEACSRQQQQQQQQAEEACNMQQQQQQQTAAVCAGAAGD